MPQTCLLHNNLSCIKKAAIVKAVADKKIRVVYGYDWGSQSDNPALIHDEVKSIADAIETEFSGVRVLFNSLGGKEGSIYCDICRQIKTADIALFDLSTNNPNVILELGMAINAGAYIFIIRSKHFPRIYNGISDLNGILEYRFTRRNGKLKFQANFRSRFQAKLRMIAKNITTV